MYSIIAPHLFLCWDDGRESRGGIHKKEHNVVNLVCQTLALCCCAFLMFSYILLGIWASLAFHMCWHLLCFDFPLIGCVLYWDHIDALAVGGYAWGIMCSALLRLFESVAHVTFLMFRKHSQFVMWVRML